MLPKINPTETASWKLLQDHFEEMKNVHIKDIFLDGSQRFEKYSFAVPEIVCDFSKNIINDTTLRLLLQLAEECQLKNAIEAMFSGEKINETEGRSVLHTALRNFSGEPVHRLIKQEGKDVRFLCNSSSDTSPDRDLRVCCQESSTAASDRARRASLRRDQPCWPPSRRSRSGGSCHLPG